MKIWSKKVKYKKERKKGGKEKEAKQKMRTSLEHVETEFQLG